MMSTADEQTNIRREYRRNAVSGSYGILIANDLYTTRLYDTRRTKTTTGRCLRWVRAKRYLSPWTVFNHLSQVRISYCAGHTCAITIVSTPITHIGLRPRRARRRRRVRNGHKRNGPFMRPQQQFNSRCCSFAFYSFFKFRLTLREYLLRRQKLQVRFTFSHRFRVRFFNDVFPVPVFFPSTVLLRAHVQSYTSQ